MAIVRRLEKLHRLLCGASGIQRDRVVIGIARIAGVSSLARGNSGSATGIWQEFYDHIESQCGSGNPLASIGDFAAKAAEHAARIAGVITLEDLLTPFPVEWREPERENFESLPQRRSPEVFVRTPVFIGGFRALVR